MEDSWLESISRGSGVAVALLLLGEGAGLAAGPVAECAQNIGCRRVQMEGRLAHKNKDYIGAIRFYQDAYRLVPDPRLFALEGRSRHKLGEPEQALGLYQRAWPALRNTQDEIRLQVYILEAQAALAAQASPGDAKGAAGNKPEPAPHPEPAAVPLSSPLPPKPPLARWRLGVGVGLAGLSMGALSLGIWANTRHGQAGPSCPGSADCVYNMIPVFVPSYVAAAALAVNATLLLTLPTRRQSEVSIARYTTSLY